MPSDRQRSHEPVEDTTHCFHFSRVFSLRAGQIDRNTEMDSKEVFLPVKETGDLKILCSIERS